MSANPGGPPWCWPMCLLNGTAENLEWVIYNSAVSLVVREEVCNIAKKIAENKAPDLDGILNKAVLVAIRWRAGIPNGKILYQCDQYGNENCDDNNIDQ